jgi:lipopolysaccharide/colanic/teichoic acid biosynthesis glycosyltransferase
MDLVIASEPRVLPTHTAYPLAKRVLDVGLCLLALPLIVPLACLCALAIYLDSGGPVLFFQPRVGRGGRVFQMCKFRTMHPGLDDTEHRAFMRAFVRGEVVANENGRTIYKPFTANQVTRVGCLLRKGSLDELPQVYHVLKGQMSIVGPRPNVPWEVAEYKLWHHERLEVLPGITGLAQVRGRSGLTFDTIVKYDLEYVTNASLSLDLKIMYWTARSILLREGAL